MIFNSISKEINLQPHHPSPTQQQPTHYYPHPNPNTHQNIHYQFQLPQKESALSQMNQKITNNIEYLKYKDHMRQKDLHSSRISNTSNHSRRSNRTINSQTNSRVSLHSPSRSSHILTKTNEHYFPQLIQTKLSHKPWETQPTHHSQAVQSTPAYKQKNEYRQFLRKPITIDNYNEKYGLNKKYSNIANSKQEQTHGIKYDSVRMTGNSHTTHRSKTEEYSSDRPQSQLSQHTFASPISKDFINVFDKQPKLKQYTNSEQQKQKSTARVVFKQARQSSQNITKRSPFQVSNTSNKTEMMIAGVLIGLGLLLLLLQSLK